MIEKPGANQSVIRSCQVAINFHQAEIRRDPQFLEWTQIVGIPHAMAWLSERNVLDLDPDSDPLFGGVCEHCQEKVGDALELHHFPIPQRAGGRSTPDNLVLLCSECHTKVETWRQPR